MRIVFVTGKSGVGKTTLINSYQGREGELVERLFVGLECRKEFGEANMAKSTNAAAPEHTEEFVRELVIDKAFGLKSLEEINNDGPFVLIVDGLPRKPSQVDFVLDSFDVADEIEIMYVTCSEEVREERLNGRDTTDEMKELRRARATVEDGNLLKVMERIHQRGKGHLISSYDSTGSGQYVFSPKPFTDLNNIFTEHYRFSEQAMSRTGINIKTLLRRARYKNHLEQGDPSAIWARKFSEKTMEELAELMREIPDTWWSADRIDLRAARVECIDAFMFWISIATALGMDANFVARVYREKMQVNFHRQSTGYTKNGKGTTRDDAHVGLADDATEDFRIAE